MAGNTNMQASGRDAEAIGKLMPPGKRFICIHGHFYQPPRENPWLETVETQDSAAPYHDWNERICAECYATNGAARIQNNKNQITRIVNNYARISFNFGPTLLSWLKENAPRTYRMILDGERRSRKNYGGHSSAMAQGYNHIILPLASTRDRITQIRWGIADYKHHYGTAPEGMWLPETAADSESLELMAQHGVKFTVLAPHQCKRFRALKEARRLDGYAGSEGGYDAALPGAVRLGRFDCGVLLQRTGFASDCIRGAAELRRELCRAPQERLQRQCDAAAADARGDGWRVVWPPPQARRDGAGVRVASAGAGPHGEADQLWKFLEQFPPEYEAEIVDDTSWSCVHGVERWRSNCGCNGGKPFNQLWRAPLRQALDELRDALAPLTEQEGNKIFKDVWAARDAYIDVLLDRSAEQTVAILPGQIRAMNSRKRSGCGRWS
jgi:alpha-amylase/alpha-mannosidase (GH57 family)